LDIALSPDERYVVTGSADNTARLWSIGDGKELLKLEGHSGEVTAVAFSTEPRGKLRVITGSADHTAKLWDVDSLSGNDTQASPTAKELLTLKGHTRALTAVAFSPEGNAVLTASRDGVAILWPATEFVSSERNSSP
jgi:WD40 repeat protein